MKGGQDGRASSVPARAALSLALGGAVALLGWRRGALSTTGALAATAVGAATSGFGGLPASLGLVAFFVTGSALSRRRAVAGEVVAAKGHRRDAVQVLANGGVAALALVLGAGGWRPGRAAALGALAAAAADTWASDIGVRSPTLPRSIVTGRHVPPGASGGVTPLGWLAAAGGALVVGGVWTLAEDRRPSRLALALLAGLAGSLADSVAGATLQAGYVCGACGLPFEAPGDHCGRPTMLARGHAGVTNDVVNAIGTVTGALVGAALGGGSGPAR
jgi:uncharacterized protein (TIGR00297 family)